MRAVKLGVDKILAVLTAILFALLVIVVTWQVVSRLVLNDPSTWSEEFAKYCFVWLSMIAAALVFGERGHIAVTFVAERFPRGARKVLAVLIQLVIAAMAVLILIWGGIGAAQNTWLQDLTALPMQIGHTYLVLPLAGAFILFYAIYNIWEDLRGEGPLTVEDPTASSDEETELALAKAREIRGDESQLGGTDATTARASGSHTADDDTTGGTGASEKGEVR